MRRSSVTTQDNTKPHRGPGRPPIWDAEAIKIAMAEICSRLAGESGKVEALVRICTDKHLPSAREVRNWMAADPEIRSEIARAREAGDELIEDEILRIADDSSEDVNSRRVRVDARLKLIAQRRPNRLVLSGDRDSPVQTYSRIEIVGIAAKGVDHD